MKVILTRTTDFKTEDFENVLNLLNAYPGTIDFVDGGTLDLEDPYGFKIFNSRTIFESQEQVVHSLSIMEESNYSYKRPVFPFKKKVFTWKQLFNTVEVYKSENEIDSNDFVFLLTNQYNDKNWFAFIGPSMRTGFIHTDDWPWFFGDNTDIRYPIAYEVIAWLIRGLMYNNQKEVVGGFHKKTVGCINDFCKNKKEITIKMRTADVCENCMQEMKNKDIPPHFLNQLFSILDGIRSNLMFRKRISIINKPSRIKIDLEAKKIFLVDFGNLDIRLNPKELSLYLLFLKHKEGIALNSLFDYRVELFQYYHTISGRENTQEMTNTILLLINYLDGELHTTLSRIKSKFIKALGSELASHYYIQSLPTEVHGIPMSREGVEVN
jgi:hypothetical protein